MKKITYLKYLLSSKYYEYALKSLIQLLEDGDSDVRKAAIESLKGTTNEETIKKIVELLKDGDSDVRKAAIESLKGTDNEEAIKKLVELLKYEDREVREAAAEVLKGTENEKAIEKLVELLEDKDSRGFKAAIESLKGTTNEETIKKIVELLEDKDSRGFKAAIESLKGTKNEKAIEKLVELLEDEYSYVSEETIESLKDVYYVNFFNVVLENDYKINQELYSLYELKAAEMLLDENCPYSDAKIQDILKFYIEKKFSQLTGIDIINIKDLYVDQKSSVIANYVIEDNSKLSYSYNGFIKKAKTGCFLLSGYRGVGKTSFLNILLSKFKKEKDKNYIVVKLNFPEDIENDGNLKKNVLKKLIRSLYEELMYNGPKEYKRLKYKDFINEEVFQELELMYLSTFYDIKNKKEFKLIDGKNILYLLFLSLIGIIGVVLGYISKIEIIFQISSLVSGLIFLFGAFLGFSKFYTVKAKQASIEGNAIYDEDVFETKLVKFIDHINKDFSIWSKLKYEWRLKFFRLILFITLENTKDCDKDEGKDLNEYKKVGLGRNIKIGAKNKYCYLKEKEKMLKERENMIKKENKIIFLIDELDKSVIENKDNTSVGLNNLFNALASLKTLFFESKALYFLIANKDTYMYAMNNKTEEDPLTENVFTKIDYYPTLKSSNYCLTDKITIENYAKEDKAKIRKKLSKIFAIKSMGNYRRLKNIINRNLKFGKYHIEDIDKELKWYDLIDFIYIFTTNITYGGKIYIGEDLYTEEVKDIFCYGLVKKHYTENDKKSQIWGTEFKKNINAYREIIKDKFDGFDIDQNDFGLKDYVKKIASNDAFYDYIMVRLVSIIENIREYRSISFDDIINNIGFTDIEKKSVVFKDFISFWIPYLFYMLEVNYNLIEIDIEKVEKNTKEQPNENKEEAENGEKEQEESENDKKTNYTFVIKVK